MQGSLGDDSVDDEPVCFLTRMLVIEEQKAAVPLRAPM